MPFHDAYARLTPYERILPSTDFPARRFPAIEAEAQRRGVRLDDPAAFALLESATESLDEWMGEATDVDAVGRFALLLFHTYHQHATGTPVYLLETPVVRGLTRRDWDAASASGGGGPTSAGSLYLQLPQHLVWSRPDSEASPLSLDGIFRTVTSDGRVHLLPVGGLIGDRPGFTVLPVPSAPLVDEPEWLSAQMRPAGGDFSSSMPGAELEGLHELATAGEVLQLVARAIRYLLAHPDRVRDLAPVSETTPSPSALPFLRVVGAPRDG
jgi:hypothetical protein